MRGRRVILASSRKSMLGAHCAVALLSEDMLAGVVLPPPLPRSHRHLHPFTALSFALVVLVRWIRVTLRSVGLGGSGFRLSLGELLASRRDVPLLELSGTMADWPCQIAAFVPADTLLSCGFPGKLPVRVSGIDNMLNLHPGRLPSNRGPNPIFWSLAEGDSELTLTLHRLTARFDEGSILASGMAACPRGLSEFGAELALCRLAESFVPRVMADLDELQRGATPQGSGAYHGAPTVRDRISARRLSIVHPGDLPWLLGLRKPGEVRWS